MSFFRVELCTSDDLREIFHGGRFDVDNVEGSVGSVEMPEIDAKVIGRDECLVICRQCYRVYVVCMG